METSNEIQNIATALASFQSKMRTLGKDSSGYGYKYISLDAVMDGIREGLAACGLSFVQMPATPPVEFAPAVALTTRLMHITGEYIEDTLVMPIPQVGKANEAQTYGAALTYARRYALTAMLGIVADEDTDGMPAQRKPQPQRQQAPQWDELPSANPSNGNGKVNQQQMKPTEKQQKALFAMGKEYYGPDWDERRPELIKAVTKGRSDSSAHLTREEIGKLLDGISGKIKERDGE